MISDELKNRREDFLIKKYVYQKILTFNDVIYIVESEHGFNNVLRVRFSNLKKFIKHLAFATIAKASEYEIKKDYIRKDYWYIMANFMFAKISIPEDFTIESVEYFGAEGFKEMFFNGKFPLE